MVFEYNARLYLYGGSLAFAVSGNGGITRKAGGTASYQDIWTGAISNMKLNVASGTQLYASAIPNGILTSQGLV